MGECEKGEFFTATTTATAQNEHWLTRPDRKIEHKGVGGGRKGGNLMHCNNTVSQFGEAKAKATAPGAIRIPFHCTGRPILA